MMKNLKGQFGLMTFGHCLLGIFLAGMMAGPGTLTARPASFKKPKVAPPLGEILARMNEAAKHLRTVSANIQSTKVTVAVDDKSTENGEFYFQKGKSTEILLHFTNPDSKVIHFKKSKAEIYLPKSNQIQEYDLEKQSGLVDQFLLLSFGTETGDLEKSYSIKLVGEDVLDGDTTAILELTPKKESIRGQINKVQLWISEESWIPIQEKLFQEGGDYLITRYTAVKVNRKLPAAAFDLQAPDNVKRVKMQ